MPIDHELVKNYRNNISLFATGVTVLIIEHEGEVRCMTANAVSSLSLEPLLFFGGKYHYPAQVEDEHIEPAADPYQ